MNLLQQLQAASAPPSKPTSAALTAQKQAAIAKAHAGQTAKALARYKEAMGEDWSKTSDIESRLGYSVSVCNAFLRKLHALGLVLRRPAGGGAYCRRKGYEWRWK